MSSFPKEEGKGPVDGSRPPTPVEALWQRIEQKRAASPSSSLPYRHRHRREWRPQSKSSSLSLHSSDTTLPVQPLVVAAAAAVPRRSTIASSSSSNAGATATTEQQQQQQQQHAFTTSSCRRLSHTILKEVAKENASNNRARSTLGKDHSDNSRHDDDDVRATNSVKPVVAHHYRSTAAAAAKESLSSLSSSRLFQPAPAPPDPSARAPSHHHHTKTASSYHTPSVRGGVAPRAMRPARAVAVVHPPTPMPTRTTATDAASNTRHRHHDNSVLLLAHTNNGNSAEEEDASWLLGEKDSSTAPTGATSRESRPHNHHRSSALYDMDDDKVERITAAPKTVSSTFADKDQEKASSRSPTSLASISLDTSSNGSSSSVTTDPCDCGEGIAHVSHRSADTEANSHRTATVGSHSIAAAKETADETDLLSVTSVTLTVSSVNDEHRPIVEIESSVEERASKREPCVDAVAHQCESKSNDSKVPFFTVKELESEAKIGTMQQCDGKQVHVAVANAPGNVESIAISDSKVHDTLVGMKKESSAEIVETQQIARGFVKAKRANQTCATAASLDDSLPDLPEDSIANTNIDAHMRPNTISHSKESHFVPIRTKEILSNLSISSSDGSIDFPFRSIGDTQVVFANDGVLLKLLDRIIPRRLSYARFDIQSLYDVLAVLTSVQQTRRVYTTQLSLSSNARYPRAELSSLSVTFGIALFLSCSSIPGLDELIEHINISYEAKLATNRHQIRLGLYDFNSLSQLYRSNTRVVSTDAVAGTSCMCRVAWNRYHHASTILGRTSTFEVCFEFIVAVDRATFTVCSLVERMEMFDHQRLIRNLQYVPLSMFSKNERDRIKADLSERGRLYNAVCREPTFMRYIQDSFFPFEALSTAKHRTPSSNGGRIMLDMQHVQSMSTNASIGQHKMVASIRRRRVEYCLSQFGNKASGHNYPAMALFDSVPKEYIDMTWPAVSGFSLDSKTWGEVLLDNVRGMSFRSSAYDDLAIPISYKRMIKACSCHFNSDDRTRDGATAPVLLLHGPPGVGKTFTVETLSENLKKPLYSVSRWQLGETIDVAEEKLTAIAKLCNDWNAILLLKGFDLALSDILLRTLESARCIVFITSRSDRCLHPALQSRLSLKLQYCRFGEKEQAQVWRNLIEEAGYGDHMIAGDDSLPACWSIFGKLPRWRRDDGFPNSQGSIDVADLVRLNLNGHEIRNSLRLATAMAHAEGTILTNKLIRESALSTVRYVD